MALYFDTAYFADYQVPSGESFYTFCDQKARILADCSGNYVNLQHHFQAGMQVHVSALFHQTPSPLRMVMRLTKEENLRYAPFPPFAAHVFAIGKTTIRAGQLALFEGTHVELCRHGISTHYAVGFFSRFLRDRSLEIQLLTGCRELDLFYRLALKHLYEFRRQAGVVVADRTATRTIERYQEKIDLAFAAMVAWLDALPSDTAVPWFYLARFFASRVNQETAVALDEVLYAYYECANSLGLKVIDRSFQPIVELVQGEVLEVRLPYKQAQPKKDPAGELVQAEDVTISGGMVQKLRKRLQRKHGEPPPRACEEEISCEVFPPAGNITKASERLTQFREQNEAEISRLNTANGFFAGLSLTILGLVFARVKLSYLQYDAFRRCVHAGILFGCLCIVFAVFEFVPPPLFVRRAKESRAVTVKHQWVVCRFGRWLTRPFQKCRAWKRLIRMAGPIASYKTQAAFPTGQDLAREVNRRADPKEEVALTRIDKSMAAEVVYSARKLNWKKKLNILAMIMFVASLVFYALSLPSLIISLQVESSAFITLLSQAAEKFDQFVEMIYAILNVP